VLYSIIVEVLGIDGVDQPCEPVQHVPSAALLSFLPSQFSISTWAVATWRYREEVRVHFVSSLSGRSLEMERSIVKFNGRDDGWY
jgi:hypothetical protein